jgi:hypothetical protein
MKKSTFVQVFGSIVAALMLASAAQAQTGPASCKEDPKFREQDFTLGHWDVYRGTEKTAEVKMELVFGDCFIYETWTSLRPGGNGHGFFAYSRKLGDWGYFWVAEGGNTTSFRGSLIKPGEMRYVVEEPGPTGKMRLRHWTLFLLPDGRVRELSVGTEDGGKTWITEYDLIWIKKDAK